MFIITKLVFFIGSVVAVVIGLVLLLAFMLNIDDLTSCTSIPNPSDARCKPADAIVAISGGDTAARAGEAIKLYKAGWAPRLIFSGAALDRTGASNAAAMRLQALKDGVDDAAITIDEASVDTTDNAKKIKQIIEPEGLGRIILVTSPYHQRRASIEFNRMLGAKVQIVNHPTPDDKSWPPNWWITPKGWWLTLNESVKVLYITIGGHN
jgi:uncharacterized SAM-binding protein YcdF (DUF218 family)